MDIVPLSQASVLLMSCNFEKMMGGGRIYTRRSRLPRALMIVIAEAIAMHFVILNFKGRSDVCTCTFRRPKLTLTAGKISWMSRDICPSDSFTSYQTSE